MGGGGQSVVHSNLCMTFKRLKTISDGLTILSEHRKPAAIYILPIFLFT